MSSIEKMIFDRRIVRIDEIVHETGYSKGYIYNLVHRGEIPFIRRGRSLFFDLQEVQEWILRGNL